MIVIGIDLGGTKLSAAVFKDDGTIVHQKISPLDKRTGPDVGQLITTEVRALLSLHKEIAGIGVCVPGIYYTKSGCVWAPNIPGWEEYPLRKEIQDAVQDKMVTVNIDSDRACYILGETWRGSAIGCTNAVFLAIGTGIGAGILCDGKIIRGHRDIAGAFGWMTLQRPYRDVYKICGCFEYNASGEGIVKVVREMLLKEKDYSGVLGDKQPESITTRDVFDAYEKNDCIAKYAIDEAIILWGMAVANIVSTFNPEKIILGGGVFGPATRFIDRITEEARKWAQPISMKHVSIEQSTLGGDAGLIGAGKIALMQRE